MRGNSIQHFRRGIAGRASRLQPRPGFSCAYAARTPRHLRWIIAITHRLARRVTWRGIHPESMTLPLASRWILVSNIIGGRSNSLTLVLSARAREREKPTVHRLPCVPYSKPLLSSQSAIDELARIPAPAILTRVQNRVHELTTATFSRHICIREHTVRSVVREWSRAPSGGTTSSSSVKSAFVHRPIRPRPSQAVDFTPPMRDIPTQVQRRHRRLEQRPFLSVRDAASPPSPVEIAEHPDVVRKLRPRAPACVIDEERPVQAKSRGRTAQPDSPVNVAQITDAVLQQLDRRLIAARERMGRM